LARALDVRIALQRRQDRLMQSETWNPGSCCVSFGSRKQRPLRKRGDEKDEDKKRAAKLDHVRLRRKGVGSLAGHPA
jgi:hypothetical protein